jgi:hypothetical protein
MAIRDDMAAAATEILEPNLRFVRQSPGDTNRYFLGPEALKAISWVVTSIALPILLAGVNEIVKARVKDWLQGLKKPTEASVELPVSVDEAVAWTVDHRSGRVVSHAPFRDNRRNR